MYTAEKSFIEQTLVTQAVDSLTLDDLAPIPAGKRVGAAAFVSF